jgi:hypothetical protein
MSIQIVSKMIYHSVLPPRKDSGDLPPRTFISTIAEHSNINLVHSFFYYLLSSHIAIKLICVRIRIGDLYDLVEHC